MTINAVLRDIGKDVVGESSKNVYLHITRLGPNKWFWFAQNREMKISRSGNATSQADALTAVLAAVERIRECRRRMRPPAATKIAPFHRVTPEINLTIPTPKGKGMRRTRRTKGCQCEFHKHKVVHICTRCKAVYHHDDGSHYGHGGIETYDSIMYAHGDEVNQLRHRVALYMGDVVYYDQSTPLHHACGNGNMPLIRVLLDNVDLNAKDSKSQTPLDWAVQKGHTGIADFLVKNGAKRGQRRTVKKVVSKPSKRRRTK